MIYVNTEKNISELKLYLQNLYNKNKNVKINQNEYRI